MDSSIRTGTPLRQRMIDDMRMRKLEHKTQEAYIRAVRKLAAFLGRSPDTATVEDLRRFQLHLVDQGTSPITLNATLTGLKFFELFALFKIAVVVQQIYYRFVNAQTDDPRFASLGDRVTYLARRAASFL